MCPYLIPEKRGRGKESPQAGRKGPASISSFLLGGSSPCSSKKKRGVILPFSFFHYKKKEKEKKIRWGEWKREGVRAFFLLFKKRGGGEKKKKKILLRFDGDDLGKRGGASNLEPLTPPSISHEGRKGRKGSLSATFLKGPLPSSPRKEKNHRVKASTWLTLYRSLPSPLLLEREDEKKKKKLTIPSSQRIEGRTRSSSLSQQQRIIITIY